jgi:hypothetical protein
LTNSVVCTSSGLLTFLSENTNTNVSLHDHGNIVSTITNGKSSFWWMSFFNQINDISFLLWWNSASEYYIDLVTNIHKDFSALPELSDNNQRGTSNDQSLFLRFTFTIFGHHTMNSFIKFVSLNIALNFNELID